MQALFYYIYCLVVSNERKQCEVPSTLDSDRQSALFALLQTSLLARLNLTEAIHVALQGLEILVVEIWNICLVLKNLSH